MRLYPTHVEPARQPSACVRPPGSRARGSAAWRPLRQSWARAPCCNGPVLHAATPRTRASAIRWSFRGVLSVSRARSGAEPRAGLLADPSRPASKASAIRVIVRPALTASSRQRCSRRQPASSTGSARRRQSSCYFGPGRRGICSSRSTGASRQLHRLDAATKLPLFLVARPIASSGSARDCTTVEVGSRASPGQSSSPAARPRLERAANGGSLGSAPGRDPAASPERAHRIPAKRCFRTRCVSADLPPGPHTRGKTRALPPCFYRRHRAHFRASNGGDFDLPVGPERARPTDRHYPRSAHPSDNHVVRFCAWVQDCQTFWR